MGARRFGPDTGRFLQQDRYQGALSDLGLGLDPLTQNRYSLAGGNPVGYIERDGHQYLDAGAGGGSSDPNPTDSGGVSGGDEGASSGDYGSASGPPPGADTSDATAPDPDPTGRDYGFGADYSKPGLSSEERERWHQVLDVASLVPGVNVFAGLFNAELYAEEGNTSQVAFSLATTIPVGGEEADAGG